MQFACLGSGSKGNAWLLRSGHTTLLMDCGFGLRDLLSRLSRFQVRPEELDAVFLTHEHTDHMRGAAALGRRHGVPAHMTHGCLAMLTAMGEAPPDARPFDSRQTVQVGDMQVTSYTVPHDAREPVQYVVTDGQRRFGLLTDAGHVTPPVRQALAGCHALALECNHDIDMLRSGPYPPALKARILGRHGHLDNGAAAALLSELAHRDLQHVVAAHLSEENNRPRLAQASLAAALDCDAAWIGVADQEQGLEWREIR